MYQGVQNSTKGVHVSRKCIAVLQLEAHLADVNQVAGVRLLRKSLRIGKDVGIGLEVNHVLGSCTLRIATLTSFVMTKHWRMSDRYRERLESPAKKVPCDNNVTTVTRSPLGQTRPHRKSEILYMRILTGEKCAA